MGEDFFKDADFSKLVKKAKRRSIIRNTVISVVVGIVLFLVLYGLVALGTFVMYKKMDKEITDEMNWQYIRGANIEERGTDYSYTPFSATVTSRLTKPVGDVPIPWGGQERAFTILGASRMTALELPSGSGGIYDERVPLYLNGQRVIEFFHPAIDYKKLFDERPLLDEIREEKVVEFAFSFDKPYTTKEVKDIFSEQLAWYWVDTYSPEQLASIRDLTEPGSSIESEDADNVYGFRSNDYPKADPPHDFIEHIKKITKNDGAYQDQAKELLDNLTNNDQHELQPANLKIIGVVVTGTPAELKKYNDVSMIRTAILGATTDKY